MGDKIVSSGDNWDQSGSFNQKKMEMRGKGKPQQLEPETIISRPKSPPSPEVIKSVPINRPIPEPEVIKSVPITRPQPEPEVIQSRPLNPPQQQMPMYQNPNQDIIFDNEDQSEEVVIIEESEEEVSNDDDQVF